MPGGGLKGVTGALRLPDGVMVVLREVPGGSVGELLGFRGGSYSRCPPSYQDAMSLQWTVVATFLYAEVFLVLLLCVPFVSPTR